MLFRYVWFLVASICVWVLLLPFLAGTTAFFVYGYLLGGTIDGGQIDRLWMVASGAFLTVLVCAPTTLPMSFLFWGVAVLLRKRLLSSSLRNYMTLFFAIGIYIFFLRSHNGWPWSGWRFGLPFLIWGFVLLKGSYRVFSILAGYEENVRQANPRLQ